MIHRLKILSYSDQDAVEKRQPLQQKLTKYRAQDKCKVKTHRVVVKERPCCTSTLHHRDQNRKKHLGGHRSCFELNILDLR